VKPKPDAGIREMLLQRLISFGLVVGVGFLLLVSLVVSAGLAAVDSYLGAALPEFTFFSQALNVLLSLGVITLLFAMVYKVLPDVDLYWRDVWVGALVTAGLFSIGKSAIGLYLGTSGIASSYGAAGSVVVLLVWVYYTAQVVLLGAEFTKAYVERFAGRRKPMAHAQRDPAPEAVGGKKKNGGPVKP
jgi:membrane protein